MTTASKPPSPHILLARRAVLHGLGATLGAASLGALAGCGGSDTTGGQTGGAGGQGASGGAGGSGAGGGGAGGSGGAGGATTSSTSSVTGSGWATGGTGSMSGDYPDPFTESPGPVCALICSTTLGPCFTEAPDRKDISEGYPGLPVRLALLVVDDACNPVPGATVDVWHTRNTGVYSSEETPSACHFNDADAMAHEFFRGWQTTDDAGRVDFDTCYPGWYGGRCIHLHFTVRVGGQAHVTSQLFFSDQLNAQIFAEHPEYAEFGQPDTTNQEDGIYPGSEYELSTEKQADGALLAWKVIVIRSSLATPLCMG